MKPHIYKDESTGRWRVVNVPDNFRDGDLLPPPRSDEFESDSEAEALAEFNRRAGTSPVD